MAKERREQGYGQGQGEQNDQGQSGHSREKLAQSKEHNHKPGEKCDACGCEKCCKRCASCS